MEGHRDLIVWQKAMSLVKEVYIASRRFPKDEIYGSLKTACQSE